MIPFLQHHSLHEIRIFLLICSLSHCMVWACSFLELFQGEDASSYPLHAYDHSDHMCYLTFSGLIRLAVSAFVAALSEQNLLLGSIVMLYLRPVSLI